MSRGWAKGILDGDGERGGPLFLCAFGLVRSERAPSVVTPVVHWETGTGGAWELGAVDHGHACHACQITSLFRFAFQTKRPLFALRRGAAMSRHPLSHSWTPAAPLQFLCGRLALDGVDGKTPPQACRRPPTRRRRAPHRRHGDTAKAGSLGRRRGRGRSVWW